MPKTKLAASCIQYLNTHFILVFISFHYFLLFSHSIPIFFNITHFDPSANNILYEGSARPLAGAIELNLLDWTCQVGQATYAERVQLWDSSTGTLSGFTTRFSFIIDTQGAASGKYGHGIAFFLAPVGYQIPPNSASGFLGLFNTTTMDTVPQNQIVLVEFDTFVNTEWDPLEQHVGININSLSSSVYASWDAGSHSGKKASVWIAYNATTKNLSVSWTYEENPVSLGNSSLTYHIDLMKVLPEWITIGFSAATGQYGERNIVNSWEFTSELGPREPPNKGGKKRWQKRFLIAAVVVGCFFTLILGVGLGRLLVKKYGAKKAAETRVPNAADGSSSVHRDIERGAFPRRFSYQELDIATDNFADYRRLGQGGSGHVYQGTLSDLGRIVAVKRIFTGCEHAEEIFINEVKIISRLKHRNLVQFIGWCHDQDKFLLVYDYMPNGSLDTHLFGNRRTLPWNQRYPIAVGLALALQYLHDHADQFCVLHRDVKSANVLLDTDYSTKLGDFGIAKLVDPQLRTQTTGVVGTLGYIAPEYMDEGRATKESDIFSFGIVALEIACGRRALQDGGVVKRVWQFYLAGNILNAADKRLNLMFNENEMERLTIVGLWCTNPNDRERPKAGQVVQVLNSEAPLPELPHNMHDPPLEVDSMPPSITSSLNYGGR